MLMLHWIVQGGAEPILIGENNLLEDKQVGEYLYIISVTTTKQ